MVRPAFVFLPEDGETANDSVARCAEEVLAPGEMGYPVRVADYISFLDGAYLDDGEEISSVATSCAIFVGGVCIHAQVQKPRKRPRRPAITTWLGVKGFVQDDEDTPNLIEGSWIPGKQGWKRGDVVYICSTSGSVGKPGTPSYFEWHTWEYARDGHVIILRNGSGTIWDTAEGGGSPGGTICRLSKGPKDIAMLSRPPRGIWRPELMRD